MPLKLIISSFIFALLAVYIAFLNPHEVEIHLTQSYSLKLPMVVLCLISILIGVFAAGVLNWALEIKFYIRRMRWSFQRKRQAKQYARIEKLYEQGENAFAGGRFDKSVPFFQKILKIHPNHIGALNHMGIIRRMEGNLSQALEFHREAAKQAPDNLKVLYSLAEDYSAAEIFLDAIDTDLIPVQGTAIGHAIRTAVKAFSQTETKSKALILITDGEDHEGKALEAAKEAGKQGIIIFTIGIGQEMGAPMPSMKSGKGFKKDKSGEVVVSRLNETILQKISLETGGSYVRSVTGDMDLNKIYRTDIKERVEKKELKTSRKKLWQGRFQWFIFLALVCLSMELGIREK